MKIITNTINNWNKYSSSVVNNHHGNINKICCPIYEKSADKIVEGRTCSILADKIGRFCPWWNQVIFAWHTTDFCRAILSSDKIGRFCRSSDIPLILPTPPLNDQWVNPPLYYINASILHQRVHKALLGKWRLSCGTLQGPVDQYRNKRPTLKKGFLQRKTSRLLTARGPRKYCQHSWGHSPRCLKGFCCFHRPRRWPLTEIW